MLAIITLRIIYLKIIILAIYTILKTIPITINKTCPLFLIILVTIIQIKITILIIKAKIIETIIKVMMNKIKEIKISKTGINKISINLNKTGINKDKTNNSGIIKAKTLHFKIWTNQIITIPNKTETNQTLIKISKIIINIITVKQKIKILQNKIKHHNTVTQLMLTVAIQKNTVKIEIL